MATLVISGPFTVWNDANEKFENLVADRYPAEFPVTLVKNPETDEPRSYYRLNDGSGRGVSTLYLEWYTSTAFVRE